ncbi:xanthine dehydrogenase small subunit [Marinicella litoralis]|uniref:Xanthine dehydrogenase small subunit n=1 Tax=Marinicella litoralis TaxID=644220 RepID=A0A4R6XTA4_9GAMM|nr:FAD binding domain-containing protein [Marinicella litoralis]TDR20663.1 xanthine dehydrogenase small subunit [Marinicella litoralis]
MTSDLNPKWYNNSDQLRDYLVIYINGERHEIRGEQAFMTLSDYLRHEKQLTGTKVVCAEGDCGACTVLMAAVKPGSTTTEIQYQSINACIQFMHGLDCCHVITIEGLPEQSPDKQGNQLHPVQQAMVQAQATQCGFCTPGFVMAAAGMMEVKNKIKKQHARNFLTGNLCRCTGYQSIINAMLDIKHENHSSIKDCYHNPQLHQDLLTHSQTAVRIQHQNNSFDAPLDSISAAQALTSTEHKIFAASTDLGVQFNKGHWQKQRVVSLNLIEELHHCELKDDCARIGARVTLSQLEKALCDVHPEWVAFMHIFASPQIKNNGTLIGNIANGSPIGDNLPFLLAMDARLNIQGPTTGRTVNLNDFYQAYRQMDLAADELITHVEIPNKADDCFLKLYKVSQRRDLDISCVSSALMMRFDQHNQLQAVAIALGGVAATAVRLKTAEQSLLGQHMGDLLQPEHIKATAEMIANQVTPMSDVRGSEAYRKLLVANLYKKFMAELQASHEVKA